MHIKWSQKGATECIECRHLQRMHRCLEVEDIVILIAREIYDGRWTHSEFNSVLASMAVTCRRFYNPAMNVLWSEMFNIMPLLQCMSPDLIVAKPPRDSIDLAEQGVLVRGPLLETNPFSPPVVTGFCSRAFSTRMGANVEARPSRPTLIPSERYCTPATFAVTPR